MLDLEMLVAVASGLVLGAPEHVAVSGRRSKRCGVVDRHTTIVGPIAAARSTSDPRDVSGWPQAGRISGTVSSPASTISSSSR